MILDLLVSYSKSKVLESSNGLIYLLTPIQSDWRREEISRGIILPYHEQSTMVHAHHVGVSPWLVPVDNVAAGPSLTPISRAANNHFRPFSPFRFSREKYIVNVQQ